MIRDLATVVQSIDIHSSRMDLLEAAAEIAERMWPGKWRQDHKLLYLCLFSYILLDDSPGYHPIKHKLGESFLSIVKGVKAVGRPNLIPDIFYSPCIIEPAVSGAPLFDDILNIGIHPYNQEKSVGFIVWKERSYFAFSLKYSGETSKKTHAPVVENIRDLTAEQLRVIEWVFKFYLLIDCENTPVKTRTKREDIWKAIYYQGSNKVGQGSCGSHLRISRTVLGMQQWRFDTSGFVTAKSRVKKYK
jgi:hypothetical protein